MVQLQPMEVLMDTEPDDFDPADKRSFREGSIVKIKMTNFITYDSVECFPGSSLNIVIGPNGTGKSTILSAIVLGLGGKPSLLGKSQSSIQEFIKTQCQKAEIEIELQRPVRNTLVKRIIYSDGKSSWQIDGRDVTVKKVEELMKTLKIQIDNLCQVLPQDRVQDFAKLNKQELLAATLKAVGKEGMFEIHAELKNLQRHQKQLEIQIASETKRRELEQASVDRLRGAVEKIDRRRNFEKEAENCQLKLVIIQCKLKMDEVKRYQVMNKEAGEKVKCLEDKLKPYEDQIKEASTRFKTAKNKYNGMDRKIFNQQNEVNSLRQGLENLRDDILELEVDLDKKYKSVENQKKEEDKVRQAISKLRNDIASREAMPASEQAAKMREITIEMEKLSVLHRNKDKEKWHIDEEIRDLNSELQALEREISRMENMKELRMRTLYERGSKDAYQAATWVDANRHRFSRPVYLPMIVELDVNPTYARYVETAIGYQDLIAITCESKDDMKLIVDECRTKMKLRINVLQVDANIQNVNPRINFNTLKQKCPAFHGYLRDFVKGPDVLLNFLCTRKNFHNIPVALDEFQTEVPRELKFYFMGDIQRIYKQSRYSSNVMVCSDPIQQAKFFKTPPSHNNLETLKSRATSIRENISQKRQEVALRETEIQDIHSKRNQKREEHSKIKQIKTTLDTLRFQLNAKEKQLSEMLRNRQDRDEVKKEFERKIKGAVLKLVGAQETFFQALKALDSYTVESNFLELEVQASKAFETRVQKLCSAERDALENAKMEKEQISFTLGDLRNQVKKEVSVIEKKYGNSVQRLWDENQELFSTLPNTVEELESHIEDKMAHAQMLGGGNDKELIRQFEGHVKTLDTLNISIETKMKEASQLVNTMEDKENKWKEELEELVNAITKNFSRYFKEMKCAGAVELYTGENERDYDNYGLRVRVKFRDGEDLQDLNAFTQSGGERAVSTAIYMLSLQELTAVPFRLVDEINQGMDSNNEQRVYELLLQSTSRPGTPQYFLLTPKLLKDMKYSSRTTVLCVMNSACAPDHKWWNINNFIALRKRMGANVAHIPSNNSNGFIELDSDDE